MRCFETFFKIWQISKTELERTLERRTTWAEMTACFALSKRNERKCVCVCERERERRKSQERGKVYCVREFKRVSKRERERERLDI